MLYNTGTLSQEGFVSGFVLVLDNGLVLKTGSILWKSADEKAKIQKQFDEFAAALSNSKDFEYSTDVQPG